MLAWTALRCMPVNVAYCTAEDRPLRVEGAPQLVKLIVDQYRTLGCGLKAEQKAAWRGLLADLTGARHR